MTHPIVEHLWCGWRNEYLAGAAKRADQGHQTSSVFTQILESALPDDQTMIIHRGAACFVILNNFPYTAGHFMVLPYREVADIEDLDAAEAAELWATVTDGVRAVRAAYSPAGVNVGINLGMAAGGSISQHLHVHVVPRWVGDANFMTATSSTRTIPETLETTWKKLRTCWRTGTSGSTGS